MAAHDDVGGHHLGDHAADDLGRRSVLDSRGDANALRDTLHRLVGRTRRPSLSKFLERSTASSAWPPVSVAAFARSTTWRISRSAPERRCELCGEVQRTHRALRSVDRHDDARVRVQRRNAGRARTATTGTGDERSTLSVTLPMTRSRNPDRPCVPMSHRPMPSGGAPRDLELRVAFDDAGGNVRAERARLGGAGLHDLFGTGTQLGGRRLDQIGGQPRGVERGRIGDRAQGESRSFGTGERQSRVEGTILDSQPSSATSSWPNIDELYTESKNRLGRTGARISQSFPGWRWSSPSRKRSFEAARRGMPPGPQPVSDTRSTRRRCRRVPAARASRPARRPRAGARTRARRWP